RSCFKEHFQMIDGFIAGSMSEYKEPNEFLLVSSTAVTLDNVRRYRFRGAANLAGFLVHLELRQALQCHAMHGNRRLSRQLPNLKISIAHSASRILQLASRITIRPRSAQAFVPSVCHIAMKATPARASKQPLVPRSTSAPCPGRRRKKSWPEYRSPSPRQY